MTIGGAAPRTVLHIDMNAFFASVEQRANPKLCGRAMAVIGRSARTVITTASYEARAYGVKTGMNVYEAKRLCPELVLVPGDGAKYVDASIRINDILKTVSPLVEVFSIDEAFVDLTGTERLLGPPGSVAADIKRRIRDDLGLACSIGIAPNKLLAKLASDMQKPDGLVIIKDNEVASLLKDLPVEKLCGIGPRVKDALAAMSITTCGELAGAPAGLLRARFGIIGERLKLMGMGVDESPVAPSDGDDDGDSDAKSIGHSTTLPRDVSDRRLIMVYLLKLSEKVARRARRHGFKGSTITLTIRYPDFHTFTKQARLNGATNDTRAVYDAAAALFDSVAPHRPVRLLGVRMSALAKGRGQMALFEDERKRERLLAAFDEANERYGEAVTWAALLRKSPVSSVISPSWRPNGVRKS